MKIVYIIKHNKPLRIDASTIKGKTLLKRKTNSLTFNSKEDAEAHIRKTQKQITDRYKRNNPLKNGWTCYNYKRKIKAEKEGTKYIPLSYEEYLKIKETSPKDSINRIKGTHTRYIVNGQG